MSVRRSNRWIRFGALAAGLMLNGIASAQPRQPESPIRPRILANQPGNSDRGESSALLRRMVEPGKQDEGPLKPGEDKELMQFAQQHLPHIAGVMVELRDKKPEAFQKKFEQVVPRLRFLKRLFATRPQIANKISKFADNRVELERLRQQHARSESDKQKPIELQMRNRLTENLDLEQELLAYRLNDIQKAPQDCAEGEVSYLIAPDTDLATEPKDIRDLVGEARNGTPQARQRLLDRMRERVDHQAETLRARIQRLRENRPETIDEQMHALLSTGRPQP